MKLPSSLLPFVCSITLPFSVCVGDEKPSDKGFTMVFGAEAGTK